MTVNSSYTDVIIKQSENNVEHTKHKRQTFSYNETNDDKYPSTIESKESTISNMNEIIEETLKSRWILQPHEIQRFKIRYLPEETGIHQRTYALSIINGDDITYDIKVHGTADIPRLDMSPNSLFSKVASTEIFVPLLYECFMKIIKYKCYRLKKHR